MAGRSSGFGVLRRAAALTLGLVLILGAESRAQAPTVRLAAPADCSTNPNCVPGLRKVYKLDPGSALVPLTVADAGIQALDDGLAEVAVAFSSNPQLSRPDVITLRDDRHMVGADHVTPIVRTATLRRYGRPLRQRLNADLAAAEHARAARPQPAGRRRPPARGRRR